MGYEFEVGLLGLLAIAMCWALAVVLYRVGARDSTPRKLAALLVKADAEAIERDLQSGNDVQPAPGVA